MKLFAAPLQGYTDAPYRRLCREMAGGADLRFTPYLRIENGQPCARTLRDIISTADCHDVVPQIIFRDVAEFTALVSALKSAGFNRADLNLGCPFRPQVLKGRGAGLLLRVDVLEAVAALMQSDTVMSYSVKMRLGVNSPWEWRSLIPVLNNMPLTHVAVHPRTALQQYRGELDYEAFEALAVALRHPVVFNGDVRTPADISAIEARYPWLYGVMAGRGLLCRPSLFSEYRHGAELTQEQRMRLHLRLHDALLTHYASVLCGEHQVLSRIKTFWDYAPDFVSQRTVRKITKARNITDYQAVVNRLP